MRSGIHRKESRHDPLFMEDGKQIPVTVLQLDALQVVAQRHPKVTATLLFSSVQAQPK